MTSLTWPLRTAKTPLKRQLLVWIVEHFGESERRVGEEQDSVGSIDEVVGAVQPPAVVMVGEHGHVPMRLDPDYAAVAVLANRQSALRIERQTV